MLKTDVREWRLLETGIKTATENVALDETILEARAKDLIPDTIRLLQFAPPAVLVGYHQVIENEVRIDYCNSKGIDIQRRITGGGTIYFDTTQVGWEVVAKFENLGFNRVSPRFFRKISEGLIVGLKNLGIDAKFRPRNDIEVHGRKISGTGGTEIDDAFLFQGTLLVDFDAETMVRALRIPVEKLKSHEIDSIKDRVTWIYKELTSKPSIDEIKKAIIKGFENALNIQLKPEPLIQDEERIYEKKLGKFKSHNWIHKAKQVVCGPSYIITLKKPNGIIKMLLGIEPRSHTVKHVNFLGDFFASPKNFIYDLECELKFKDFSLPEIEKTIFDFFKKENGRIIGFSPKDFIRLFSEAKNKTSLRELNFGVEESNNLYAINSTYEQILKTKIKTLLLPYCAKGAKCKFRKKQGCPECGLCTVGDAYELARSYGYTPITITSFKHLMQKLRSMKNERGFIGLCCEQFYIRHKDDMEKHGLPGLLINIETQTCYDLDQAYDARLGNFGYQTNLPISLLRKVLTTNRHGL